MKETDLYPHVKALLVAQGYDVKAEIGAADVVALRPGEDEPVIVELKTGFALTLFHQAVARQAMTDFVYVAVPRLPGKRFLRALKDNKTLCRRLGLGLITVRLSDGHTEVHLDPAPYAPRKVKAAGKGGNKKPTLGKKPAGAKPAKPVRSKSSGFGGSKAKPTRARPVSGRKTPARPSTRRS